MRYFKIATHLTVPRSLLPGAGNTHKRPAPGEVIAIDDEACARESRFINGRLRAGDMIEVKAPAELDAPAAKVAKGK